MERSTVPVLQSHRVLQPGQSLSDGTSACTNDGQAATAFTCTLQHIPMVLHLNTNRTAAPQCASQISTRVWVTAAANREMLLTVFTGGSDSCCCTSSAAAAVVTTDRCVLASCSSRVLLHGDATHHACMTTCTTLYSVTKSLPDPLTQNALVCRSCHACRTTQLYLQYVQCLRCKLSCKTVFCDISRLTCCCATPLKSLQWRAGL